MKRKEWVTEYFHFSRRDRLAILFLLVLTLIIYLLPKIVRPVPPPVKADTAWMAAVKELEELEAENGEREKGKEKKYYRRQGSYEQTENTVSRPVELFYFDPNTLSADGWRRLGLREKTIQTIERYRNKGGRFRQASDLERIYGLFPDEYERLAPWVQIAVEPETQTEKKDRVIEKSADRRKPVINIIDINTADTADFISLPGIGSKLAGRIVNFRDKLGGFYAVGQLAETFGLPDSTFQKIRPWLKLDSPLLRKININSASLEELKAHPYIRYTLARPLLAYRTEHGRFAKPEDLKKIAAVSEEVYQKLIPYLSVE